MYIQVCLRARDLGGVPLNNYFSFAPKPSPMSYKVVPFPTPWRHSGPLGSTRPYRIFTKKQMLRDCPPASFLLHTILKITTYACVALFGIDMGGAIYNKRQGGIFFIFKIIKRPHPLPNCFLINFFQKSSSLSVQGHGCYILQNHIF